MSASKKHQIKFLTCEFFLHFGTFCVVVLQLILASKLSELEQFENQASNYQLASKKGENETLKKTNAITKL